MEVWKQSLSFPQYEISNQGNVRHVKFKKTRKPLLNKNGYLSLMLNKNDKKNSRAKVYLHRLVAEAFIGQSKLSVDHINGVRTDNRVENLRYLSLAKNSELRLLRKEKLKCMINDAISLYIEGKQLEDIYKFFQI